MKKTKEELDRLSVDKLIEERRFIPQHNARYLEHLKSLASENKDSKMKKSAIKSLLELKEDSEYNKIINKMILIKRHIPSIFGLNDEL